MLENIRKKKINNKLLDLIIFKKYCDQTKPFYNTCINILPADDVTMASFVCH